MGCQAGPGARGDRATGGAGPRGLAAVLALAVVAAFLPAVGNGFTALDDRTYILRNRVVLEGLTAGGVRWALTSFHAANWHPLTWLSHMLDVELFGTDPRWHHLEGILIHAASASGVFLFLRAATGAPGRSLVAAALFALHPQRVESVAWAAERKDVLATLFWVLALNAWVRHARRPSPARFGAALAAFAFSLLAKPSGVTLPLVLLILDAWPLGRCCGPGALRWGRLLAEKIPFGLLAAAATLVTWQAQSAGGMLPPAPIAARIANVPLNHADYLADFLLPIRLYAPHGGAPVAAGKLVAGTLALAALTGLAVLARRTRPFLLAGWAWYLVVFLPTIGLVPLAAQSIADRYTYLPSVGMAVALAWGGASLLSGRTPAAIGAAAAFATLTALGLLTWRQTGYWRNDLTLHGHAAAVAPGNPMVQNNLGVALADAGRAAEATLHYREALRLNPRFIPARANLARACLALRKDEEAVMEMRRVLEEAPGEVSTRIDLGVALMRAGAYREALLQYRTALRGAPESPEALTGLASALAALGRGEEARAAYVRTLGLWPGYAPAVRGLAALGSSGRTP